MKKWMDLTWFSLP